MKTSSPPLRRHSDQSTPSQDLRKQLLPPRSLYKVHSWILEERTQEANKQRLVNLVFFIRVCASEHPLP
jgi:hypothetical protein